MEEILKEKLLENHLKQTNNRTCLYPNLDNKILICSKARGKCNGCEFYLKNVKSNDEI